MACSIIHEIEIIYLVKNERVQYLQNKKFQTIKLVFTIHKLIIALN